ncbi:hypothetical protein CDAR_598901 [Caerostris darwini]|uniref:Uncharacterized protein n=1 Tax=Caerostris darwini TaxID=1538125 RepID=A0AAV4R2P9_9ARAC|nr:hypothetical protein CDAR_598901 [Caerostris darwini]
MHAILIFMRQDGINGPRLLKASRTSESLSGTCTLWCSHFQKAFLRLFFLTIPSSSIKSLLIQLLHPRHPTPPKRILMQITSESNRFHYHSSQDSIKDT